MQRVPPRQPRQRRHPARVRADPSPEGEQAASRGTINKGTIPPRPRHQWRSVWNGGDVCRHRSWPRRRVVHRPSVHCRLRARCLALNNSSAVVAWRKLPSPPQPSCTRAPHCTHTHTHKVRAKKKKIPQNASAAPRDFRCRSSAGREQTPDERHATAARRYIDPYTCVGDTAFHPPLPLLPFETRVSRRVPTSPSSSSLTTRPYCTSASRVPFVIR